ncbi:MAG: hypothetical protein ACRCZF_16585, partial [Gemmataceae bacterium]
MNRFIRRVWNNRPQAERPALRAYNQFQLMLNLLEDRSVPATLTVTNTADAGAGSLRDTIAAAAINDDIVFDPAVFSVPQVIQLTSGQISVTKSITITGPGKDLLSIQGAVAASASNRIFNINVADATNTVSISNITITGGNLNTGSGAGIQMDNEKLNLSKSTIVQNKTTDGSGGGISITAGGG